MKKVFKITVGLVLGALLVLALGCITLLIVPDQYLQRGAETLASRLTNHRVSIDSLKVERNLAPSVELTSLTVANAEWSSNSHIVTAERLSVSLSLPELAKGLMHISQLSVDGLIVSLETNSEGQANWLPSSDTHTQKETTMVPDMSRWRVDRSDLSDIRVDYVDQQTGQRQSLELDAIEWAPDDNDMTYTLKADGTINQQALKVAMSVPRVFSPSASGRSEDIQSQNVPVDIIAHLGDMKLNATASLDDNHGGYALSTIDATLAGESAATAIGSIGSLFPFDDMELDVKASLASLDELSTLTTHTLPDIGPWLGTEVLQWQDGNLALSDAKVSYSEVYGTAVATGRIGNVIGFDEVHFGVDVDAPGIAGIALFTDTSLAAVGGFSGSAELIASRANNLSASNISLNITKGDIAATVSGSIDSIIHGGSVIDLEVSTLADSLIQFDELAGMALPDLGPLTASAHLSGIRQSLKQSDIVVELNDPALAVTARSDGAALQQISDLVFDAELSADSLSTALHHVGIESSIDKPATLSARLSREDQAIQFRHMTLDMGEAQLTGDLSVSGAPVGVARSTVEGDITVEHLDLVALREKAPLEVALASKKSDDTGGENSQQEVDAQIQN